MAAFARSRFSALLAPSASSLNRHTTMCLIIGDLPIERPDRIIVRRAAVRNPDRRERAGPLDAARTARTLVIRP